MSEQSRYRRRIIEFDNQGYFYNRFDDKVNGTSTVDEYPTSIFGFEEITDVVHPGYYNYVKLRKKRRNWKRLGRPPLVDIGGPLDIVKCEYDEPSANFMGKFETDKLRYTSEGRTHAFARTVTPASSIWTQLTPPRPLDADLFALGGIGMRNLKTDTRLFDMASFLGELHEGLPGLPGKETIQGHLDSVHSNLGGEYLNLQFGIKPIISDIRKLVEISGQVEKRLDELEKLSGKLSTVQFHFPPSITTSQRLVSASAAPNPAPYGNVCSPGRLEETTRTETETWVEGSYTHYMSIPRESWQRGLFAAQHVLGIDPSAETVWNLTPWTWLLDWKLPIGDFLSQSRQIIQDGLVFERAYVMQKTTSTKSYILSGALNKDSTGQGLLGPAASRVIGQNFSVVRKTRRKAHQFGFGMTDDQMTDRQKAILAALGFAKSGRL